MTLFRLTLSFTAAIACFAAPVSAQSLTPQETARVDQIVAKNLVSSGVPSASVAIVRGGRIVFAKAYGKQSETMKVPRDEAPYQIASISKQFAAAAILLLQHDGKLSLDDTVSKYVPDITNGDTITIRQLLSHTAGLQDYWPQDYSFKAMASPVSPQGILDRWAKKPLDFTPGTKWQYSNTGYVVAGLIVEKVSGRPLLEFLKARIFTPLGITAYDQDIAIGKGFPQGYGRAALGPVRPVTPAAPGWLFSAGELSMSARDLAKWDVARIDRTILTAEDWKLQETPVKLADGSSNGYGLGVSTGTTGGRFYVEHSGEAVGFLSENVVYPDDKAAIVVLTNSWSGNATDAIQEDIAKAVLPATTASTADTTALAHARAMFAQLRTGNLDRSLMTDDSNYYFTDLTLSDYKASLMPLGKPVSFTQTGKTRLRGGFVNRNYKMRLGKKDFVITTYAEPGDKGRYEQFLVAPAVS